VEIVMPQIGDLFVNLGSGEALTRGEIETLRLEMNRIQSGVSRLDTIMGPTGGLDPSVFQKGGGFSLLPAECALIKGGAGQTIGTSAFTVLDFATETFDYGGFANLSADDSRLTIPSGMSGNVFLVGCKAVWGIKGGGNRVLRLLLNGAIFAVNIVTGTGIAQQTGQIICYPHLAATGDYFTVDAWQDSGDDISLTGAGFWITRLR
jgi:hypothetical protein